MSRNLLSLIFALFLATGLVLGDDEAGAKPAPAAPGAHAQTKDVPAGKNETKEKTEAGKAGKEGAKAGTEEAKTPDGETKEQPEEGQAQKDGAKGKTKEGPKQISGMSILGNQEAPKSLVIVPWKSSVLGKELGISTMLDDSKEPVDREVFMRELSYYEIRAKKNP
ncbi:MAG TPA: hypothetical protein VNI57_08975 [Candidatus Saccharimonadales bacterium]|nr:hypothetical protein [Candidatus Saccharimonadales bacterium]